MWKLNEIEQVQKWHFLITKKKVRKFKNMHKTDLLMQIIIKF